MRRVNRMRRGDAVRLVGASLVTLAVTCGFSGSAQAKRRAHPPVFAGLESATTCVPGPVRLGQDVSYHLVWKAAKPRPRKLVYNVYQATSAGGEDFSAPTYTTAPGATSFDTPMLPVEETFYFVVRARDTAGNEDTNTVEREGQNLCE